ncbi:hypothetical protein PQX77_007515, partial [Marasmius sp. AFHP31]
LYNLKGSLGPLPDIRSSRLGIQSWSVRPVDPAPVELDARPHRDRNLGAAEDTYDHEDGK